MTKKEKTLIIIGIIFISFNLRAPITSVGSVVQMISQEYGLSSGTAGFMTTLPLIAFALVSPFVAKFTERIGYGKTMMFGLFFIIIGELVRSYTNIYGLFIGTCFLGIGIAIGNVLIPSFIKLRFSGNIGLMTSLYSSSMCIFAAIGAGISLPMATSLGLGWKNSLASWFVIGLVTIVIWLPQTRGSVGKIVQSKEKNTSTSIWKNKTAWYVTLFMGTQSLIFYSMVAWLPTIVMSKDMTPGFAGNMALAYQLVSLPATLIVPILCDKYKSQKALSMVVCGLYICGLGLILLTFTPSLIFLGVILSALGMGGSFSIALAFISLRSSDPMVTSKLSGMAQSAGYLLAAVGPTAMGYIYDLFQSWSIPLIIFMVLVAILALFGWKAGKDVMVKL